jgi:hypothetical protein
VGEIDHFSVTISRVNENMHDDPYFTMEAHSLTVKPDGSLYVEGQRENRGFSGGLWDGFEVKRLSARRG